ncbi:MAG: hypothetical protein GC164_08620 [Phycisphaera sp.]|nr:hypothetical protein [Phycisphaera sp.]
MKRDAVGFVEPGGSTPIDWPAFLGRHDMGFNSLPTGWQEAPHTGNGQIGAMLYVVDGALWLQVFRNDIHDHRDETHGWTAYSRPRFLIGHFELRTTGILTGCQWYKSLWNAELSGTITTDHGDIAIRHFTHAGDMAIITTLTPSVGEAGLTWTWHPHPAQTTRPGYPTDEGSRRDYAERYGQNTVAQLKPWTPNPDGRLEKRDDVYVWVQDLHDGGQYATAWAESGHGDSRTLVVSIANSFPDANAVDTAVSDVKRSLSSNPDKWLESHRAWWHGYYPKSFVTLPDRKIEALYWQTVYRLGCTSRTGRSYIDTSGLWFQGGPWPYSTHDWNTQTAHWSVYAANHLEQGRELVDCLHRHSQSLIEAVHPEEWRSDSAYLALATAGDMVGFRTGDMRYYALVGCLPWLLHNVWWLYRFSMDESILRDTLFPLLRRAVNLYLHLTEQNGDGRIELEPTYSPETGVWRNANFDLALFKWGCHVLLWSCKRLNIDDPLIPRWREVTQKLIDFPVDQNGFMLGSEQSARLGHRHLSHLLMVYPLALVNIDQPGALDVLNRSYEAIRKKTGSEGSGIPPNVAMLQAHAAPIGAVLGRGDDVLAGLRDMAGDLLPNGLWACAGNSCIEAAMSVMNILQNMLIQSWTDPASDAPGPIRVFPALPSEWRDVEFHDLRAEGAFLVSAKRVEGRTQSVRIKSLAGEPCIIQPGFDGDFQTEGERSYRMAKIRPGVFAVDLRKGEQVTLALNDQTDRSK